MNFSASDKDQSAPSAATRKARSGWLLIVKLAVYAQTALFAEVSVRGVKLKVQKVRLYLYSRLLDQTTRRMSFVGGLMAPSLLS